MPTVSSPFEFFTTAAGLALDGGYIYVGTAGLPAETNPIACFTNVGLTVPISQPLRTSGGRIVSGGSPVSIFIAPTDYSIVIKDKKGVLVYQTTSVASINSIISLAQGGTGATTQAGALVGLGALGNATLAKTANYTVLPADRGDVVLCNGTFTLSITAASTLGDGFCFAVVNTGSGTITVDPNSSELIDGASTKSITAGQSCFVVCNGTEFRTVGIPAPGSITTSMLAADAQFTDTTRIDVASAATVDLSTLAPNTRNINITGTTTITGFTIAVGRLYFVRFNSALTLTNNASIITQTGANITTAAGDTCIIRATATNTVEVLCYAKLLVRGASVASTSGTSIDFTGLPSWVKRITIQFSGVSTTGSSSYQVQIGSGSFSTSGYSSVSGGGSNAGAVGCTGLTSGFAVTGGTFTGANAFTGALVLTMITNNTFVMQGNLCIDGTTVFLSAAGVSPTLGGALDRVRITTVGGTDTFDAGTINIMYEG